MNEIIIVSGLPRSGTSMMMQMLEAGGVEVLTDGIREVDEDNPKGYYEYEKTRTLKSDSSWLEGVEGKAVKIVSPYLKYLPSDYSYKILFMRRDLDEVLRSQMVMLDRRKEYGLPDMMMKAQFMLELVNTYDWFDTLNNVMVLLLDYENVISSPVQSIFKIMDFLDKDLDISKMYNVIDPEMDHSSARRVI